MAKNKKNVEQQEVEAVATEQSTEDVIACYVKENEELIAENEKLKQELEKSQKYLDQLVSMKSDFENYKRRVRMDAEENKKQGIGETVEKIFAVLDTFELASQHVKEENSKQAFALVQRQFEKILSDLGVTEIEVLNLPFDAMTSNALSKVSDQENSGKVVQVYQKGYRYDNKILRYAQVIVAE
ncbi:MAG: nucleotide exchange factor GrpE [Clostridia bacterium]|nr:nucleotide exchange factor GrpE [Clostridia bacterium]